MLNIFVQILYHSTSLLFLGYSEAAVSSLLIHHGFPFWRFNSVSCIGTINIFTPYLTSKLAVLLQANPVNFKSARGYFRGCSPRTCPSGTKIAFLWRNCEIFDSREKMKRMQWTSTARTMLVTAIYHLTRLISLSNACPKSHLFLITIS